MERSDSDILPPIAPNPVFNTEKEIIFKTSDIFDKIIVLNLIFLNFTLIVLNIIVSVFDVGVSFGKVKSGKKRTKSRKSGNLYSKLRRNPVCIF